MVCQGSFCHNLNRWDKIMKTYTDKLVVNMNAKIAWESLKMMDKWLPNLSTNQAIHFEGGEDFFYEGRKYDIVTKEGIKTKGLTNTGVVQAIKKVEVEGNLTNKGEILTSDEGIFSPINS